MSIQQEKFKAIADKIRSYTGETETIIPNSFTDKIDEVYQAGRSAPEEFTNVLKLDSTVIKEGYKMTASAFTALNKCNVVCLYLPYSGEIALRFRSSFWFPGTNYANPSIYTTDDISTDTISTTRLVNDMYNYAATDECGDLMITVNKSNTLKYLCFNMTDSFNNSLFTPPSLPLSSIITVNELIGKGSVS